MRGPLVILPTFGQCSDNPATSGEENGVGGVVSAGACCVSLMIFNEQLPLVILQFLNINKVN